MKVLQEFGLFCCNSLQGEFLLNLKHANIHANVNIIYWTDVARDCADLAKITGSNCRIQNLLL